MKSFLKSLLLFWLFCTGIVITSVLAQDDTVQTNTVVMNPSVINQSPVIPNNAPLAIPGLNYPNQGIPLSNLLLPTIVLIFGILMIGLIFAIHKNVPEFGPDHAIKIVSIALLIIGILFIVSTSSLIDVAQKSELYAPAFGILGTLAGYLLSKNFDSTPPRNEEEKN